MDAWEETLEEDTLEIDLRQYVGILRRWWWLWMATTLVAGLTALIVSLNITPVYKATTQLLIQQASNPSDVVTYSDIMLSERLARTYAKLLTTRPVLERTLKELGLEGQISIEELKERISVQPVRDTTLIQLGVEDTDPERAIALANKLPEVFARYNEQIQLSRFQESKRSLEQQLKRLEEELSRAQRQLANLKSDAASDPADITRLETQITTLQASYANLLKQYEEIRLAEAQSVDNIIISEPATTAEKVRPRTLLNTLLAAIVGLMLGIGAVFLKEYLDDTIKTPDEIERAYRVPVLAGIARVPELSGLNGEKNRKKRKKKGKDNEKPALVVHTRAQEPISEAFRALRTNLQFASVDTPLHSLVITSPEPSEGKSFVAANLAIVIAQADKRVILVDADIRKPNVHRMFELPQFPGLTNALLDASVQEIERYLQNTDIENLRVMTAGVEAPNPAELLGSQRMQKILDALLDLADMVIIDTPPVLVATDAAILASKSDGVLIVARVGQTPHPALQNALKEIQRVNAHIVGIVLNELPSKRSDYYYKYYPYQYGYYGDGTKPRKGILDAFRQRISGGKRAD